MPKLSDLKVVIGLSKSGLRKLNQDLATTKHKFRKNFGEIQGMVSGIGRGMTAAFTVPLVGVGAAAVQSAAQLETLETSFISLTGGAKQAADMMAQLNQFTAKTPFQIENVANAARQLIASGTEVSQVNDQLQFLGDIAATSGVSIEEIAAIFAKVNAKGKVELENLNQLAERGIPIFDALATATGLPADKLGAGAVSVEQFNKVLSSFAQTGGFAAGAMERLSGTAAGKFSTALDNLKLAGASLAKDLMPMLKSMIDRVTALAQNFIALSSSTKKSLLAIGALLAAAGPIAMGFAALMPAISVLMGPIGAIGVAIAGLAYLIVKNFAIIEKPIIEVINDMIMFQNKTKVLGIIFSVVKTYLVGFFNFVIGGFKSLLNIVGSFSEAVQLAFFGEFEAAGNVVAQAFKDAGNAALEGGKEFGKNLVEGIRDAVNAEDIPLLEPGSISKFATGIVSDINKFFTGGGGGGVAVNVPVKAAQPRGISQGGAAAGGLLLTAGAATQTTTAVSGMNDMVATSVDLAGQATNAFTGLGEALAGIAMGTMTVGNFLATALTQLADLLGMIGQQFIAAGVAAAGFYANLIANPFAAVAAGVALVAASGIIKSLGSGLNEQPPAMAAGGLFTGASLAYVGEGPGTSMVNPEVVAPLDKLQSMMGGGNVTVTGRLDGRDILISSERAGFDRNRVRGF